MSSSINSALIATGGFAEAQALSPSSTGLRRTGAMKLFQAALGTAEILGDFFAVLLSSILSFSLLHVSTGHASVSMMPYGLGLAILFLVLLEQAGGYRKSSSLLGVRETERTMRASAQAAVVVTLVALLKAGTPAAALLLALVFTPLFVLVQKQILALAVTALHKRGFGVRRVLIYGAGLTGRRIFSILARSPRLGMEPVAMVDDNQELAGTQVFENGYKQRRCITLTAGPITEAIIRHSEADTVIIGIPGLSRANFLEALAAAAAAQTTVSFVPHSVTPSDASIAYRDVDGTLLASFQDSSVSALYIIAKRILDVAGAGVVLLLCAPLLLIVAATLRLTSAGPVLFTQTRVGARGRLFRMFKFRTMYVDAPAFGYSPKESSDPRITPVGRFLRRTSLDELPQLLNVLHGEMSLVGPRPEMPFIVEQYSPLHRRRLEVKPGITGLWQLSADRAYLIHENIEYDLYYIKNRNLFMDMAVLAHTAVFAARGV